MQRPWRGRRTTGTLSSSTPSLNLPANITGFSAPGWSASHFTLSKPEMLNADGYGFCLAAEKLTGKA